MTVSSIAREATSACNGATTVFPVPFQFIVPGDLTVLLIADSTGLTARLTEGVDYTLGGSGPAGTATVTTTSTYAAGFSLRRRRETAMVQTADYVANDGFPAKLHELQLDRLTMVDQEQAETIADTRARAPLLPAELGRRVDVAGMFPVATAGGDFGWSNGTGADLGIREDLASVAGTSLVMTAAGDSAENALRLKADRQPVHPYSDVIASYDRVSRDMRRNFLETNDASGRAGPKRHIKETQGDGGAAHGTVVPGGYIIPTFWMMAMEVKRLFWEWKFYLLHDPSRAAEVKAILIDQANYLIARFPTNSATQGLGGDGSGDATINTSDDAVCKANVLADLYEATGIQFLADSLALMIVRSLYRFRDVNQTPIGYGLSVDGVPFQSYPYGMLYAQSGSGFETLYGRISTTYEVWLAIPAYRLWQWGGEDAFRQYAIDTWARNFAQMRTVETGPLDAVSGLYQCEMDLLPGSPTYRQQKNVYYGSPKRGVATEFEASTQAMAVLAAYLYRDQQIAPAQRAVYLAEAASIAGQFMLPRGFGRMLPTGKPGFGNLRDPWSNAYYQCEFAEKVLALPGVDLNNGFKIALLNTARYVAGTRTSAYGITGVYPADWGGPETNVVSGAANWAADAALGYGGGAGAPGAMHGGQATADQIMTNANSAMVVMAGAFVALAGIDYEAAAATGLVPATVPTLIDEVVDDIDALQAQVAALSTAPPITAPRYTPDFPLAYAGLDINPATGKLFDAGVRHFWLDQFYPSTASTDSDALQNFAYCQIVFGDCVLHFKEGRGRGPNGRYIVDREIKFTGLARIVLDFGEATIRYTAAASKFRHSPSQVSSNTVQPDFFIMRGGVHQYAAAVDCIGFWDFPFKTSRVCGTGYAEKMRILPQDENNVGHTLNAAFRTKNAWYFSASQVHFEGPPRPAGSLYAGGCFLEQQGLCVVAIIERSEVFYSDLVVKPTITTLVGVTGSFTSGGYARGKRLRQGAVIGYLGANDGFGGYAYTLYEASGTFAPGACDVLDNNGTVVGNFTITAATPYARPSEALQVSGGSTFVNVNYFANFTVPAGAPSRMLDWTFNECHVAFYQGCLKVDGVATLQVGTGMTVQPLANNLITFDIKNGDTVSIVGMNSTTNGYTNCTFAKLRNIVSGVFNANNLLFYATPFDTDDTVKDTVIADNTGYQCGAIVNTGKRYNATNNRGLRFRNNGEMGRGFDTDDNRRLPWDPQPTPLGGAFGSAPLVTSSWYTISDGVLTFAATIQVTNRGTASGGMLLVLPGSGWPTHGAIQAANFDRKLPLYATSSNYGIFIYRSAGADVFQDETGSFGNFTYVISGSMPVEYD